MQDVDFRIDYAIPAWLGHKVLAVSLSDIAATGGRARYSLLGLAIPRAFGDDFWEEFFGGYFALADRFGVKLIGGDTSAAPERLVLDSIVIGECPSGRAVRRSGARVGDDIYVTGVIGGAHAGLVRVSRGLRLTEDDDDLTQRALRRHLRPEPPIEFGRRLGESGLVHSMIDVSDGLAQDLQHICIESGVSAEIEAEEVPLAPEMQLVTEDSWRAFSLAINGGEDFELLFSAATSAASELLKLAESCGIRLSRIGRMVERAESWLYLVSPGASHPLTPAGYDHFG
jgi:thiamine-monophosphate kinase